MTFEMKRGAAPKAWQFEMSGKAARRGPSGLAMRRGLSR